VPRPRKTIDKDKLKQLAALGLTSAEMAAFLDCSKDTLERRYKPAMETGRQMRNASLRRKQYEVALTGNPTMLIWLGKQFLGQKDQVEHSGDIDSTIHHVVVDL
jgi:hypothetical protein